MMTEFEEILRNIILTGFAFMMLALFTFVVMSAYNEYAEDKKKRKFRKILFDKFIDFGYCEDYEDFKDDFQDKD